LRLVQGKLTGTVLEGELQPSYHRVDLRANMFELGQVSYVPWEKCTKCDAEMKGIKIEKIWKPDSEGLIQESSTSTVPSADIGSDLLLRYALQRRGIALEIANICDFQAQELWIGILFDTLLSPAPPGYHKVTWNQLKRADEEMFRRIARECTGGLRFGLGERPPFEMALKKLLYDPGVRLIRMPLPASSSSSSGGTAIVMHDGTPYAPSKRQLKRLNQQKKAELDNAQKVARTGNKGDGKGKGTDNLKLMANKTRALPSNGEPICFNYNIRGCPNAAAGGRWPRGWHVCAEPGCQKDHPMSAHGR